MRCRLGSKDPRVNGQREHRDLRVMPGLTRTFFALGFAALLPLVGRAQEAPTLDSDAFNTRLLEVNSEYRDALWNIESQRPQAPNTDAFIYPRYRDLSQSLTAALRSNRLLSLSEPLAVIQRVSPTFVIAGGFDAPAAGLRFCDNDICKYTGPIFVHLRQASVANKLAPGWLRYDGLRSYTTALGAADTIPEFSEVTLDGYPNMSSEERALRNFRPSNAEQKQYAEPIYQRYHKNLEAYYAKLLQLDVDHLGKRLAVVQQMATPLFGVRVVMIEFNGLRPVDIPESMAESLPNMLEACKRDTLALTREIGEVLSVRDEASWLAFLKYTQAWIHFPEKDGCSGRTPRPTPQQWPAPYLLTVDFQPWCSLRSWTRFEIPRLGGDGRPTLPDWWGQYEQQRGSR